MLKSTVFSNGSLPLVLVLGISPVAAQDSQSAVDPAEPEPAVLEATEEGADVIDEETFKAFEWGSKGLDIRSRDGNFHAHIDWRAQLRFTSRDFDDPIAPSPEDRTGDFVINRARFKLGGHAYRPWLKYYLEHDLVNSWLLDLRFTLQASDGLQLRVGQWKVPYNRERVDSSGKQQFAERSIVTPWFTLDRQQGAALFGRFWEGTTADSWYNVGFFQPPDGVVRVGSNNPWSSVVGSGISSGGICRSASAILVTAKNRLGPSP